MRATLAELELFAPVPDRSGRGSLMQGATIVQPTLGRIVHYRGKEGRQSMRAAIVTGTVDSVTADGIACGDVPGFDSPEHVHLWVFTPGNSGGFAEFNVPLGEPGEHQPGQEIPPGTWSWPPRV